MDETTFATTGEKRLSEARGPLHIVEADFNTKEAIQILEKNVDRAEAMKKLQKIDFQRKIQKIQALFERLKQDELSLLRLIINLGVHDSLDRLPVDHPCYDPNSRQLDIALVTEHVTDGCFREPIGDNFSFIELGFSTKDETEILKHLALSNPDSNIPKPAPPPPISQYLIRLP